MAGRERKDKDTRIGSNREKKQGWKGIKEGKKVSFRKVIDEEEKQEDDWCSEDRDNKGTGESEGGVKREDERSVEEKIRVMESDMRELKEKIRMKKEKRGLLSVDDRSIGGYILEQQIEKGMETVLVAEEDRDGV